MQNEGSMMEIEQDHEKSLQELYALSKKREKKMIYKIHLQNQEIEEFKLSIQQIKQKFLENKPSDIKQDIVYDRLVNNELNALIDIQKALENKMEDLKLNIIRKRIEKSEEGANEEIGERFRKNESLGKKIGKTHFENLQMEIQLYKNFVEELKDEKKKLLSEISDIENEQKNENETISTCKRMLKEQELKNAKLQKEIDELKEELKIK